MRIVTWNINGLRAAHKKGLATWVTALDPDVLALQEVRATPAQLPKDWALPAGLTAAWHPAERLGWSGVAVWSRVPAERLGVGLDAPDPEGRVLRVRAGGVQVISTYLPSGGSGETRQAAKEAFMERFLPWSRVHATSAEPVVIVGDLNIAHGPRDVANPRTAQRLSGYLPHERLWFDELLAAGWVDVVRRHVGPVQGPYTWWSNFGKAKAEDRGWRIDHVLANPAAAARVRSVRVDREAGLAVSDHAPVIVELD